MLFLRKIAIFALRITGRRVGDGPGEMPEWSIGPHSKCGVRATVPGVRIPLSPQMTGRSVGLQTNVCNLFYFRGGQICPERFEDKSWSYGWQAKIRSSQGRLQPDGGKDGRQVVTRSRARSAEEWKRGEMLYGNTAFLSLQRGKVVRMGCRDRMADTFFVSGHLYPPAGSGRGVFCEADPQSLIFQTIKFEKPQTLLAAFQLPG